jgi:DEAD/DEAH box helicase domain-containing protein
VHVWNVHFPEKLTMVSQPIILDLETKHTFHQFSDPQKLGVSVVVIYDYADQKFHSYTEDSLKELFPRLENASYVIGYNIASFDLQVLQAYYHGSVSDVPVFDMLEDIRVITGRRFGLNDIASATLGIKKSGNGLQAIEWYKTGQIDKIITYCQDDVNITRKVFEYGATNGCVYVGTSTSRAKIEVRWERYQREKRHIEVHHTLPF